MICLPTDLHVTGLRVAGEILFINSLTNLAVLALRSGVGAGPDLHHDPPATRGVARRVHGRPRADKIRRRLKKLHISDSISSPSKYNFVLKFFPLKIMVKNQGGF